LGKENIAIQPNLNKHTEYLHSTREFIMSTKTMPHKDSRINGKIHMMECKINLKLCCSLNDGFPSKTHVEPYSLMQQ
jgi:hypothetical protein